MITEGDDVKYVDSRLWSHMPGMIPEHMQVSVVSYVTYGAGLSKGDTMGYTRNR